MHHLSWVSILSNAAIVEHRRLQRLCLDEGESDALEPGVSHVLYPPPAAVKAALEMSVYSNIGGVEWRLLTNVCMPGSA